MKECDRRSGLKLLVANAEGELLRLPGASARTRTCRLCEGLYDGTVLTCHQHLWQWDIRSGAPIGPRRGAARAASHVERRGRGRADRRARARSTASELFVGLSPSRRSRSSMRSRRATSSSRASVVYKVGDPADDFFVLDSGRVEFLIGRDDRTSPPASCSRRAKCSAGPRCSTTRRRASRARVALRRLGAAAHQRPADAAGAGDRSGVGLRGDAPAVGADRPVSRRARGRSRQVSVNARGAPTRANSTPPAPYESHAPPRRRP